MIIIGIDCGIKSFAITITKIDKKKISIICMNVYDLLENKTTKKMILSDNIRIASNLKKKLENIEKIYIEKLNEKKKNIIILIEFQLGINIKSKTISSYCIYHFCDKYDVKIIFPGLKTKYSFNDELDLGTFMEKYSTNYTAQKKCSLNNFLYWIRKNRKENLIQHIKKKNLDDIADSFMMIYNWCYSNNYLE